MTFKQIQPVSAVDQIIEQVLNVIRSENIQAGDKLPSERELAKTLGVSRPTLREAVVTLATIGVLEIRRGIGTFVAATDFSGTLGIKLAEIMGAKVNPFDALELRVLLEPGVAALAAERGDKELIKKLERNLEVTREKSARDEVYFEEDHDFHLSIVHAINNSLVEHALGTALEVWFSDWGDTAHTTMSVPGTPQKYHLIHERIVDAIKASDPERAYREMEEHFRVVRQDFLRY